MIKFFLKWIVPLMVMVLFSGCVKNNFLPNRGHTNSNQNAWADETNIDDVNIDDLDENLTESEMSITEDGEENKLERIPFPTSEYYGLARTGKGTVKGMIYVEDAYGKRVPGSNTRLYLNPLTSYSRQWYEESYLGGYKMQKADSRLFNYLKFTAADSAGNFAFYGVPSGSYYLIGTVKCGEACGYESEKSIRIATRVRVQGNQIIEKDLTRITD